jgi:hypothetical protein
VLPVWPSAGSGHCVKSAAESSSVGTKRIGAFLLAREV